jgi:hypothetical protein
MRKEQPRREFWAYTYHGPYRIEIYKKFNEKWQQKHQAESTPAKTFNAPYTIDINPDFFNSPAYFNEILIHEFTHILEWIYPPACFSPRLVEGCSALAKTIGAGIGEMLSKLTQHP